MIKLLYIPLILSLLSRQPKPPVWFTYTLAETAEKGLYNLEGKLVNVTGDTIYFLSESCNGLDYFLTTEEPEGEIYITLFCNSSEPLKNEIKPNSTYSFKSQVKLEKKIKDPKLYVSFVQLPDNYNFEGKGRAEIEKDCKDHTFKIKGKLLNKIKL